MSKRRRTSLILFLLLGLAACGKTESFTVNIVPATVKVLPDVPGLLPSPPVEKISLAAARGEAEGAQLVVTNLRNDSLAISLSLGSLKLNTSEITPAEAAVLREYYVQVEPPSPGGIEGHPRLAGRYPDPLAPVNDAYNGEPFSGRAEVSLAPGERVVFWIEWRVPSGLPAGDYQGDLSVSGGGKKQKIPVSFQVWDFEIPSPPTIKTHYHLFFDRLRWYHRGAVNDPSRVDPEILKNYENALHEHRIDVINVTQNASLPWQLDQNGRITGFDWSSYDAELAPRLDGSYYRDGNGAQSYYIGIMYPGGKVAQGSIDDRCHFPVTEAKLVDADYQMLAQKLAEHLKAKGWLDRSYIYVADEPFMHTGTAERIKASLDLVFAGDPDWHGHILMTNFYRSDFDQYVDIFTPDTNKYGDWMWKGAGLPGRDEYPAVFQKGKHLRFYVCLCTQPPYAGYDIDSPLAFEPRILKWQAWREGADGFLYWGTNWWVDEAPWTRMIDSETFPIIGRTGDGFLLYPGNHDGSITGKGSPAGVALDGPVLSLRLKAIRDGLEDWEMLKLAEEKFGRDWVIQKVEKVSRRFGDAPQPSDEAGLLNIGLVAPFLGIDPPASSYDPANPPWSIDPQLFYQVRNEIGEALSNQ